MEVKKKQEGRYNEQELALIKQVFSNEDLLKAIQKVFLQLPLNALDLSNLQTNLNEKVNYLLRKMFLPELTDDVPYRQVWDLTLSMNFKDKMHEEVVLNIKSNEIVINFFDQQLKFIEKGLYQKIGKIVLSKLLKIKDAMGDDIFVNVMARNNIVGTVAGRLENLYNLATIQQETLEQRAERLSKDSTK